MSRYYNLVVGPETQAPSNSANATGTGAASNNSGAVWTNFPNGKVDLGAQTIVFDIEESSASSPSANQMIRIWGPTFAQISQASDFNGATLTLSAGMVPGLPLATAQAANAGIIVTGTVFQAFGNYQGTIQTLDFVINGSSNFTQANPGNFVVHWVKGQTMAQALQQTLNAAFSGVQTTINISPNLVLTSTEDHVCDTLEQLGTYANQVSLNILGGDYQGVSIVYSKGAITVTDGTVAPTGGAAAKVTQITVEDLIGQVTWMNSNMIQFSTVLRSDLSVKDRSQVMMPPYVAAQAVTTGQSGSNARVQGAFTGTWTISYARHVGNSRDPDAQAWVSVFQAFSNKASAAAIAETASDS